jgi:hypothetical protein
MAQLATYNNHITIFYFAFVGCIELISVNADPRQKDEKLDVQILEAMVWTREITIERGCYLNLDLKTAHISSSHFRTISSRNQVMIYLKARHDICLEEIKRLT